MPEIVIKPKFAAGDDIVYHKLTGDRGMVSGYMVHADNSFSYRVIWETKELAFNEEYELMDEEEFKTFKILNTFNE